MADTGGTARDVTQAAGTYDGGTNGRSTDSSRRRCGPAGAASLDYEPIVGLVDGRIRGVHVTDRDPGGERSELLVESCRDLGSWGDCGRGAGPLTMSLRLGSPHLADPMQAVRIARALDAGRVPSACLRLEVPEALLLEAPRRWSTALAAIRSLGVTLWIADFGAGFLSFSHLRSLPVDGVTLGAALVSGVGERDRPEESLVAAAVAATRSLGLPLEAEGVGRRAQALRLRALGCDAARGALYGAPLTAAAVPGALVAAGGGGACGAPRSDQKSSQSGGETTASSPRPSKTTS
jgi:EAL domain-containing protein (putative c-di-GMP-specific phosphodiesterase class I)